MTMQSLPTSANILDKTTETGTILDRIAAKKAERIWGRLEHTSLDVLRERAFASPLPTRSFAKAIRAEKISMIAEVKKASPSKGVISTEFHPAEQSLAYERGGAAAVSVLTEQDFFLGSDYHLTDVIHTISLPVLRKDFTIDPSQIYEARILGASAILLIAALLPDKTLHSFMSLARELRLSVLLEVHTMDELMRALSLDAQIIGINNRDLHTFHVDLSVTERLAPLIPTERTIVAESGIHTASDLSRCYRSGVHSVLIGESLMKSSEDGGSTEKKMHELLSDIPTIHKS